MGGPANESFSCSDHRIAIQGALPLDQVARQSTLFESECRPKSEISSFYLLLLAAADPLD